VLKLRLLSGLMVALPLLVLATTWPAEAAQSYYVAPHGSDTAPGTISQPFKSITKAVQSLRPGDTLYVRGGTYAERVRNPTIVAGTPDEPITVMAYPGERPVIEGLLWLRNPSHWTVSGVNVTWGASNSSSEHMVKITDGVGWRLTAAEIWGARSYAAILVAGAPSKWTLDRLYVHDTHPTNSTNQDHLIYVNGGDGGGVIERNVLARSPNGRAIKIGPPSGSTAPIGNVVIRHNTMVDNWGPSNIQLSYGASHNKIYRNIFVRPKAGSESVTAYRLNGTNNVAWDNIGWGTTKIVEVVAGLADNGGHHLLDPLLDVEYRPRDRLAAEYGRHAGESEATPTTTTTITVAQSAPDSSSLTTTVASLSIAGDELTTTSTSEPAATTSSSSTTTSSMPNTTTSTVVDATLDPTTTQESAAPMPEPPEAESAEPFVPTASAVSAVLDARGSLDLVAPTPTSAGDLVVATISTTGEVGVTTPPGWMLLDTQARGNGFTSAVYVRYAEDTTTAGKWHFDRPVAVVGTIVAIAGPSMRSVAIRSNALERSKSSPVLEARGSAGSLLVHVAEASLSLPAPTTAIALATASAKFRSTAITVGLSWSPTPGQVTALAVAKPVNWLAHVVSGDLV
jgi:hypothetical protein